MIEEVDCERFASAFNSLSSQDQKLVLAAEKFGNFSPATREVYAYLTRMYTFGKNTICIPAMLIPAMLEMEFVGSINQANYRRNHLLVCGAENKDWKMVTKSALFGDFFNNVKIYNIEKTANEVKFQVPGQTDKTLVMSKDAGNAIRFPFVTPKCAAQLLIGHHGHSQISKELARFYIAVHEEVISFLIGKKSMLDNVAQPKNTLEDDVDEDEERLAKRLRIAELKEKLMESEQRLIAKSVEVMRARKEAFDTYKTIIGDTWDDRDAMLMKDTVRSCVLSTNSSTTFVDSSIVAITDEPELMLSTVARELGMTANELSAELPELGRRMAKAWAAANPGKTCPRSNRLAPNGAKINPYMYFERDRSMMENVVQSRLKELRQNNAMLKFLVPKDK